MAEREEAGVPDLRRQAREKVLAVEYQPLEGYIKEQVANPREVELNRYAFTVAAQAKWMPVYRLCFSKLRNFFPIF